MHWNKYFNPYKTLFSTVLKWSLWSAVRYCFYPMFNFILCALQYIIKPVGKLEYLKQMVYETQQEAALLPQYRTLLKKFIGWV